MAHFKGQMLWENIKKGDLSAVHGLLESGNINLEERDEAGRTFLMVASDQGELNIVRELLEAGVDPNAVDSDNWSALLCASKEGHLEIVIELLEHQADIEHKDVYGWTALMWASYKGRIIVVQELLERGANANAKADHNMTSLAWAAGRGHTEIVQMLINKGAKVNTADKYGTTPLIWACRKGYLEIVNALLNEGAQVDASGMNSWTPLLIATKGGHYDVVHALLQHDPNVNAVDKDGLTPLAIAAKEGFVEIGKDLLNKGARVNVVDRSGDSILIHAVKGGQVDVVRALLAKYVDVDVQGTDGKTALYWAVEKGHIEIVKLLLSSEPDLEICTKDEDTALLRAVRSRSEECVRMLLEKGAKVSASDKRGDTALHIAIRARSKRITELLLRNPRNSRLLYRPNKDGETPYSMDTYHQRGILPQIYGHRNLNASDAENLLGYDIYSGALADILSDPTLTTPITVGLYAKWGSGKSFLINKLQSEMKSFTQQNTDEHFLLTWTVALLSLFVSLMVGEALVLGVSLKVGVGVAAAVFCLQLMFFGGIMLADQKYSLKVAVGISMVLGLRQRRLMLLLRLLFCNPKRPPSADKRAANVYSVRFLFSECTRLTSVGGEKALAAMIGTLCHAVEKEYGFLVTRLFRVFKPGEGQHRGRFKSLCCIPYFLIVLLVLGSVAVGVALLVQFRISEHIAVDSVLIAIACILTLTLVSNIYTLGQAFMSLLSSQKRRVIRAADDLDTLKMDGFLQYLKSEVELMSRMILCMDTFTADQTRLVVIVDGLDSCEQYKVLQVLDTVKSLFSDDNTPYITILAVDPHIIIKGIEQNLKTTFHDTNVNGFDYLRNIVHLPFYLQSQGARVPHTDIPDVQTSDRTQVKFTQQESVISSGTFEMGRTGSRRKSRTISISRQEGLSGSVPQMMYASSIDLSNTFARNDYFSDINPRSMRRLMNIVSVTARLLRAYNIEFKWHRLAAWINIIEQWPYRVSWIIYHYEESDIVENSTTLYMLYQRVFPRIPVLKEVEPLLEIDRNVRKLEAFLSSKSGNMPILNVGDLRKFLPCTINLDPYLRKLIRETEHQMEMQRQDIYPSTHSLQQFAGQSYGGSPQDAGHSVAMRYRGQNPLRQQPPPAAGHGIAGVLGAYNHLIGQYGLLPPTATLQAAPPPSRRPPSSFFKPGKSLSGWAQWDVEGICSLLSALKGISPASLPTYMQRLGENNISGLVLQNCDLDALGMVLDMRFGDWQLFKAAILSLREWDVGTSNDNENAAEDNIIINQALNSPSFSGMPNEGGLVRQTESRVVGPRGQRMRRNDSIVQQLSYETAILREAVEELVEETDGGEDDLRDDDDDNNKLERGEGAVVFPNAFVKQQSLKSAESVSDPLDPKSLFSLSKIPPEDAQQDPVTVRESHPRLTSSTCSEDSSSQMDLSQLVTVVENPPAPGKALFHIGSPEDSQEFTPFMYQTPTLPELAGIPTEEQAAHMQDESPVPKHKSTLTSSIERLARPIFNIFDHARHTQHSSADSEMALVPIQAESVRDVVMNMPTQVSQDTDVISPWDRMASIEPEQSSYRGQEVLPQPSGEDSYPRATFALENDFSNSADGKSVATTSSSVLSEEHLFDDGSLSSVPERESFI